MYICVCRKFYVLDIETNETFERKTLNPIERNVCLGTSKEAVGEYLLLIELCAYAVNNYTQRKKWYKCNKNSTRLKQKNIILNLLKNHKDSKKKKKKIN